MSQFRNSLLAGEVGVASVFRNSLTNIGSVPAASEMQPSLLAKKGGEPFVVVVVVVVVVPLTLTVGTAFRNSLTNIGLGPAVS